MDILTAMNSIMQGEADIQEWQREFEEEWTKPALQMQLRMMWAAMPPEARDRMQEEQPEEYEQIMQVMGQKGR